MFQHELQWCGVVVCSAVDVCCVCCAFSSSHGRTREGGERRGGGKIIFYPFTAIINAIIEFETGTSSS